eukprot:Rhum_TRINITY_DN11314_c1_g1::Rhum_TRINITY_DN11314_c1_g1_i1::g.43877::m.43877
MADHHDHATFSEKVRGAFEELDSTRQRAVSQSDWIEGLKKLRIDTSLTATSVAELFRKTDLNQDGVVSFTEFQRFAEQHPTMLDSIYYRARDHFKGLRQQEECEGCRAVLRELRDREAEVAASFEEAQLAQSQCADKVASNEAVILDCKRHEEELKENLRASRNATVDGRSVVGEKGEEVSLLQQREGQIRHCIREAQAKTEQLVESVRYHDAEVDACEERVRNIERMLAESRHDLEAKLAQRESVHGDIRMSRSREEAAAADLHETALLIQAVADSARVAEENVRDFERQEREAAAVVQTAAAACARAVAERDGALRELQASGERVEQVGLVLRNARAAAEQQQAVIGQAEQRIAEFNTHRRIVEDEEAPLIDQEAHLREQRDTLDEREARLRTEVHAFTSYNGRSPAAASPGGRALMMGSSAVVSPRQDAAAPTPPVRPAGDLGASAAAAAAAAAGAAAAAASASAREGSALAYSQYAVALPRTARTAEPYQLPAPTITSSSTGGIQLPPTRLRYD